MAVGAGIGRSAGELVEELVGRNDGHAHAVALLMEALDALGLGKQLLTGGDNDDHVGRTVGMVVLVEWTPFSDSQEVGTYSNPYTVNLDLFTHGFVEVSLETALNDTTYAVRKIEDIEYSFDGKRAQMRFTYVTEEGSSVWELHAENTGEELDISDIGEADQA